MLFSALGPKDAIFTLSRNFSHFYGVHDFHKNNLKRYVYSCRRRLNKIILCTLNGVVFMDFDGNPMGDIGVLLASSDWSDGVIVIDSTETNDEGYYYFSVDKILLIDVKELPNKSMASFLIILIR